MKFALFILLSLLITGCQTTATKMNMDEMVFETEQNMEKGDQFFVARKFELALGQYLMVLVEEPDNIDLLGKIAYSYEAIGNDTAAEHTIRHILTLQPDHVAATEWLGLYFLKLGKIKQAKKYLMKAYSLGQAGWRLHNALGLISDLDMNYTQAREHYQLSLKQVQSPKNTSKSLNNIGFSYYLSGELNTALAYFDKALVIEPDSRKALSNKALVLVRLGQETQAEYTFFRIMDKHEAYNNIGLLDMIHKRYGSAERYFKLAINTSPVYYKEAQENLSLLLRRNQME